MHHLTPLEKLLLKLLHINSVSGNEMEISNFLVEELAAYGFNVLKKQVTESRFNVVATKGRGNDWIVAHMDTVPGEVPVRVTRQRIYGRGACDNKGNIAAALVAAETMENINILLTVGEEVDFCGARSAELEGERIAILEPTDLEVKRGQNGVICVKVSVVGKEQHSANTFRFEESATHLLVNVLENMRKKEWSGFNIGMIHGGTARNVVAGHAEAYLVVRPKTHAEYEEFLGMIQDHWRFPSNLTMTVETAVKPIEASSADRALFFTEAAFVKAKKELFIVGAGSQKNAHTPQEYVLRSELCRMVEWLRFHFR
jgi:acetylornithine deacetylase